MTARTALRRPARPGFAMAPQPREEVLVIECQLKLHNDLAVRLNAHATRLRRAPDELLADIVTRVLEDDLVGAVLDEGSLS